MPDPQASKLIHPKPSTTSRTRGPRWRRDRSEAARNRGQTCPAWAGSTDSEFSPRDAVRRSGSGRGITAPVETTRAFATHSVAGLAFVEAGGAAVHHRRARIGRQATRRPMTCALLLIALEARSRARRPAMGGRQLAGRRRGRGLLSAYLGESRRARRARVSGTPGFLAWALIEYARTVEESRGCSPRAGASSSARSGMKTPPAVFRVGATGDRGLFDFLVDHRHALMGDRRRRG